MEEATKFLQRARSNQSQHVDYENLDIDLVKFLESSMSENKYQLFWISPSELKNKQKIFGTAKLSAKYSAEWTYLHKTGARTKKVILKLIYESRYNHDQLMKE
ncbi:20165_t:CDS:1, partial [Racocetra fulgida]